VGAKHPVHVRLEQQVGDLYRALGFRVDRDVLLMGSQIDLLARRFLAGTEVVTMIEVKHTGVGTVPKSEVLDFLRVAHALLDKGVVNNAVMVTDGGYTRFAKEAASDDARIDLLDVRRLASSILSPEASLQQFVNEYERQELELRYIDLDVQPDSGRSVRQTCSEVYDHLQQTRQGSVVLFADYGAGKTTTLRRMRYHASQAYLSHESDLIPLFVALRDRWNYATLNEFVLQSAREQLHLELSTSAFFGFVDSGRFLILLDGFDEMTIKSDAKERAEHLVQLSPLLLGPSPAVMSTRPTCFSSATEYRDALKEARGALEERLRGLPQTARAVEARVDQLARKLRSRQSSAATRRLRSGTYDLHHIEPLVENKIDDFLRGYDEEFRRSGFSGWADVKNRIGGIYDLGDLMTRPILLTMIVDTILSGEILADDEHDLGPADLYEAYTQAKLGIDWDKEIGRSRAVGRDQRTEFALGAALAMEALGRLELTEREWKPIAKKAVPKVPRGMSREKVETDVRTCSFLSLCNDGSLQFAHRSFQEFFVARALSREIQQSNWGELERPRSAEILYFLGSYSVGSEGFRHALLSQLTVAMGDPHKKVMAGNLASAVLHGLRDVYNVSWRDVHIDGVIGSRCSFHESELSRVVLRGCRSKALLFESCAVEAIAVLEAAEAVVAHDCAGALTLVGRVDRVESTGARGLTISVQTLPLPVKVSVRDGIVAIDATLTDLDDVRLEVERPQNEDRDDVGHGASVNGRDYEVRASVCTIADACPGPIDITSVGAGISFTQRSADVSDSEPGQDEPGDVRLDAQQSVFDIAGRIRTIRLDSASGLSHRERGATEVYAKGPCLLFAIGPVTLMDAKTAPIVIAFIESPLDSVRARRSARDKAKLVPLSGLIVSQALDGRTNFDPEGDGLARITLPAEAFIRVRGSMIDAARTCLSARSDGDVRASLLHLFDLLRAEAATELQRVSVDALGVLTEDLADRSAQALKQVLAARRKYAATRAFVDADT
jgi:hypothetical protein